MSGANTPEAGGKIRLVMTSKGGIPCQGNSLRMETYQLKEEAPPITDNGSTGGQGSCEKIARWRSQKRIVSQEKKLEESFPSLDISREFLTHIIYRFFYQNICF